MDDIQKQIHDLQLKADVMETLNKLLETESVVKFGTKVSEEVKAIIDSKVKNFLKSYLQDLTANVYGNDSITAFGVDSNNTKKIFTEEEIYKLKTLAARLGGDQNQTPLPKSASPIALQPISLQPIVSKTLTLTSKKGKLLDTTLIEDTYGPVENIYPEIPIRILSKNDDETYQVCLADRPQYTFVAPESALIFD